MLNYLRIPIIILILFFGCSLVFSQSYEYAKGFSYKEVICGHPQSNEDVPVLFALHFSGAKPEDVLPYFGKFEFPIKVVFIIGNHKLEKGYSFYPPTYYDPDFYKRLKTRYQKKVTKQLIRFIRFYIKNHGKDSKTAIVGASQGGDLALLLASNYPNVFDLSIPIAATIETNAIFKKPHNKKHVSIQLLHGGQDTIVPITSIRRIYKYLEELHYQIHLNEFPNKSHEISKGMIEDVAKWLKAM